MNDYQRTSKADIGQISADISAKSSSEPHNKKNDGLRTRAYAVRLPENEHIELEAVSQMRGKENAALMRGLVVKKGLAELGKAVLELDATIKKKKAKRFRPDIGEARALKVASAAKAKGISSSKFVQLAVDEKLERL